MKRIIWLLRYAWYMKRHSAMPWSFCWESAVISLDDWIEGDMSEDPTDVAHEGMSNWDPE
jgi:hypothetical protein